MKTTTFLLDQVGNKSTIDFLALSQFGEYQVLTFAQIQHIKLSDRRWLEGDAWVEPDPNKNALGGELWLMVNVTDDSLAAFLDAVRALGEQKVVIQCSNLDALA